MRSNLAEIMPDVARILWGEPNPHHSNGTELRWGAKGARCVDVAKGVWFDNETKEGGGVIDLLKREGVHDPWEWLRENGYAEHRENGGGGKRKIVATYDYTDEQGNRLFQVCRLEPKTFRQRRPVRPDDPADKVKDGWIWNVKGVRKVPFRLPELIKTLALERQVFIVEGEKDVLTLARHGITGTSNAGGAHKWDATFAEYFVDADVVILPDNDKDGRQHAQEVAHSLTGKASRIRIVELPGLAEKGDVSDWFASGGTVEALNMLVDQAPGWIANDRNPDAVLDAQGETTSHKPKAKGTHNGVRLDDFYAYMPEHRYLFAPSGEVWPASSVNARLPNVGDIKASAWLDQNRAIEQMTWAPGEPTEIMDKLIADGGWFSRSGCRVFNLYRPPIIKPIAGNADRWLHHIKKLYGEDASHIVRWCAHRVQKPDEKINHALVLGGKQGIGKDTLFEPVKRAVGPWNVAEVSPQQLLGRFNGFLKSVILRVSEARDLGDFDRFAFYDHTKSVIAAPPDVLRIDEKNRVEYYVLNLTGVAITTNHKSDGIYLPADDRRHFVAWSDLDKSAFTAAYWRDLWRWYENGGCEVVAHYLHNVDLGDFDPKAPPPQTNAFFEIVNASRSPEDAELADALDLLADENKRWLTVVTVAKIVSATSQSDFIDYLTDRKNSRKIPHRFEACGYTPVRNPDAEDGLWAINGRRQVIYARSNLTLKDRIAAAQKFLKANQWNQ